MRKKLLLFVVLLICFSFQPIASVYAAATWSETRPAGDTDQNWAGVKTSRDGSVLLAGVNSGRLYVSRDSGSTWEEVQPAGDNDNQWLVTGVSGDGQTMIAGFYGNRLYLSHDAGRTWTDTQAAGDVDSNWQGGAISGDGQTIIAGINPGRLYISTDGGDNWAETRPAGNTDQAWIPMALSDNGNVVVAGVYGSRLYRSTNQGSSWSEIRPAGDNDFNWNTVGVNSDGQTVLVGIDDAGDELSPRDGKLYLSQDGGNSWSEKIIAGPYGREWRISSVSDDGQTMFAGYGDSTTAGRLFLSTNAGSSWAETQPAGDTDYLWKAGALSGDGYTLVAAAGTYSATSRIYVGTLPRPTVSSATTGAAQSSPSAPVCANAAPASAPNLFQLRSKGNSVTVYFSPDSGANTGYYIGYGFDGNAQNFGTTFNYVNSGGVVSYTVNDLFPGLWYFKVRGQNGCQPGDWSGVMKIKVTKSGTSIIHAVNGK